MQLTKFFYLLILISLFALNALGQNPTPTPPKTISEVEDGSLELEGITTLPELRRVQGKAVSVYDGDTITVLSEEKTQYKCRFNGIDAPEKKQDFGTKSQESLASMVFGKTVTIEYNKVDKYGRFVCKVLVDGMDTNLEQIKRGFAWHYKKYQDEQTPEDRKAYADAEVKAREQKLGLWADLNPTPPWDWRRGVNNPNLEGVPKGAIIGNTNSMIYHTPGCSSYAKVSPKNRIIFKDEKEAISKGYRLSSQCESTLSKEEKPKTNNSKQDRQYTKGPRGGCYYLSPSGKKVYVDRGLCN